MTTTLKTPTVPKDVALLQTQATSLVIKNTDDLTNASALRESLKKKLKEITAKKDVVLKPMLEAVKGERGRWKPAEDAIDEALSVLDTAMSRFQTAQRKIELAKENKIADQMAKGNIKPTTAVRKMDEIERAPTKVTSTAGSTGFVTTPFFALEDISKVPKEYLLIDEVKIRKLMLAGVKVEGVRYWTEERARTLRSS